MEPYYACPYCLNRIDSKRAEAKKDTVKSPLPEPSPKGKEEPVQEAVKVVCRYHLGYLSERSQSEQVSEECLACKDLVTCMLRKMKE